MSIFSKIFGQKSSDGETPEFKALLDGSMEGLRLQSQTHQNVWGFGKAERWDFAQETSELIFTFPDKVVRAPAQIIGSFNGQDGSWLWAWANPSLLDPIKRDSIKVREYGEQHKIQRLITAKWPAEESDGWNMTALASRLCGSNGAYRGPAGATFVFFTFGEIQLAKRT